MAGTGNQARESSESGVARTASTLVPPWLWKAGTASWLVLGIVAAIVVVAAFVAASATISIPLILAVVIGTIAAPIVEGLAKRRVPRKVAAVLVLVALILILVATVWVTVSGVISQGPQIWDQIEKGAAALSAELEDAGIDVSAIKTALAPESAESAVSSGAVSGIASTLTSALSTGLSSIFGFFFGLFISVALLYYVLSDFTTIKDFIGSHLGLPPALGEGLVRDAVDSLRGYFRGTTITGLVVGAIIGLGVWIAGVPLALPIAVVTFLTCYIPYFGAILSGAFAVLVALGSAGFARALVVLAVVVLAQTLLQTPINAKVMGQSLHLHPLVVLVVTVLGSIFAGVLGGVLAAPLTALAVRATARFREASLRAAAAQMNAAGAEIQAAGVES